MLKKYWKFASVVTLLAAVLSVMAYTTETDESERKVKQDEIPSAALATLKRLAAGAEISQFAREVEHGHTFYEGSWKNDSGTDMDVLVTPTGDLAEIEEQVSADNIPAAVLKTARKAAGMGTRLAFEKKTTILYEVKFSKGNGQHELVLTPDGRNNEKEREKGEQEDERD